MKDELADPLFALQSMPKIRRDLESYRGWFNGYRIHEGLGGRTPSTVFAGRGPRRTLHPKKGERFALSLRCIAGNPKLPVFRLVRAA